MGNAHPTFLFDFFRNYKFFTYLERPFTSFRLTENIILGEAKNFFSLAIVGWIEERGPT
jgi:hypothetical protein